MNLQFLSAIVLMLIGLGILSCAIKLFMEGIRSYSWPSVQAKIVGSSVKRVYDDGVTYWSEISYTYEVAGHEYTGADVSVGGNGGFILSGPAKSVVKKYPVGAIVLARYSPKDPQVSVLEPGISFTFAGWLFLSLVFLNMAFNLYIGKLTL